MIEVIRRPEIIEYGTGFTSRWKCAWLPVLYKLQSNRFPVNTDDATQTISFVQDNGEGLAEFAVSGAGHGLNKFDWVNVTTATVDAYEGIAQVIEVDTPTRFTLNKAFTVTATGSSVKYYKNYHALVEVYGGMPSGHEFEAQDPSVLTTTVKVSFDDDNIAIVDLSRIAQTLMNNIFDRDIISWPNVLNFWSKTEILIKESFDLSDGTTITTEEIYNCLKDHNFKTGADWSNEGAGTDWTFGSDQANVNLTAGASDSKELTQTILGDALARYSITITYTITHSTGTPTVRIRAVIGGTTTTLALTSTQGTTTTTVTGLTTDATGVFSLEADLTIFSIVADTDVVIDDVEVCIGLGNQVANSKLAFRNGRGGNMIDHIARDTSTISKWMTPFTRPTLFVDEYFSLSVIIESLTFANSRLAIEQLDANGVEVADDLLIAIDDQDQGIYQLRIDQLGISPLAKSINAVIVDITDVVVGGNWVEVITGTALELTTVQVTSAIRIYIAGNDPSTPVLKRSDNAGDTFANKAQPGTGTNGVNKATGIGNEDQLFVAQVNGFGSTTDGLDSYDVDNSHTAGGPVLLHAASASDVVVQNKNGGVRISADGGATWGAPANSPPTNASNYTDIFMISATNILVCGLDFKIYLTTDGGATAWTLVHTDTQSLRGLFMATALIGWCVGDLGTILKTTDGGANWTAQVSGVAVDLYGVYFLDVNNGWAVGDSGTIIETTDGGATWTASTVAAALASANFREIDGFNTAGSQMAVTVGEGGKCAKVEVGITSGNQLTEKKRVDINRDCSSQDIYLMWLNNLGGWDFWKFTGESIFTTEINDSQRTEKNIYDNWPASYNSQGLGNEARISAKDGITIISQRLTDAQADAIAGIKTSMHVIWVKEGLWLSDAVTVLVDKSSFSKYNEADQRHTISFNILMTDEKPTQSN